MDRSTEIRIINYIGKKLFVIMVLLIITIFVSTLITMKHHESNILKPCPDAKNELSRTV